MTLLQQSVLYFSAKICVRFVCVRVRARVRVCVCACVCSCARARACACVSSPPPPKKKRKKIMISNRFIQFNVRTVFRLLSFLSFFSSVLLSFSVYSFISFCNLS